MHDWVSPFGEEMPFQFSKKQWCADCQDGDIVEGDFVGSFLSVPIPTAGFRRWDQGEKQMLKLYAKGCSIWCPLTIYPLCRVLDVGKRAYPILDLSYQKQDEVVACKCLSN